MENNKRKISGKEFLKAVKAHGEFKKDIIKHVGKVVAVSAVIIVAATVVTAQLSKEIK